MCKKIFAYIHFFIILNLRSLLFLFFNFLSYLYTNSLYPVVVKWEQSSKPLNMGFYWHTSMFLNNMNLLNADRSVWEIIRSYVSKLIKICKGRWLVVQCNQNWLTAIANDGVVTTSKKSTSPPHVRGNDDIQIHGMITHNITNN